MNKAVVIFESKYGSTKKYAQWIADELNCDLFEKRNVSIKQLEEYDIIIFGGGLYAGGLAGIELITKAYDTIKDKKIVIFTCGLADTQDKENTESIRKSLNKTLTESMQQSIKVFHLRGGIDYSKLNVIHRAMMAMMHKMTLKKGYNSLNEEEKEMLDTYGKVVDFTDRKTIEPIILSVREN